jgi:hypothetical protein
MRRGFGSILERAGGLFSSHTRFDMGDGSKITFWDDMWCGDSSLKEAFPGLYDMHSVKDAPVLVNMDLSSGSLQWNVSFIRLAHDREVNVFGFLLHLVVLLQSEKEREVQALVGSVLQREV